jgi:hypothetical protein
VQAGTTTVGYLHKGTNYVLCQQAGGRVTVGAYFNSNWAWTVADNGKSGWVNAVYASGGDNDGAFGGVPNCNNAHGAPPAAASTTPPNSGGGNPPPPAAGGTAPLLSQKAVRAGNSVYGKCTGNANGTVACANVRYATLPLPASFATGRVRTVQVHAVALGVFQRLVADIDAAGLGRTIRSFGTVNRRTCNAYQGGKPIRGCVSIHSWGLAVDVNHPDIPSPRLRTIFTKLGFYWGGRFTGNTDPPHFQYTKDAS